MKSQQVHWTNTIPAPSVKPSIQEPEKKEEPFYFKCVKCWNRSDVLFEGTSYCQDCLKEQLRIGGI